MDRNQKIVCIIEVVLLTIIMLGVWLPYMKFDFSWWKPCHQSVGYYCTNYTTENQSNNWTYNSSAMKEWIDWRNKIQPYVVNYSVDNLTINFSNCTEIPCDCWKEGCLVMCLKCY